MLRRNMPGDENCQWEEKMLIFFLVGVLIGIVIFQFPRKEILMRCGFFSENIIEQLRYMEVNRKGLFFYCLGRRLLGGGILFLFGLTNLSYVMLIGYVTKVGFETGTWLTIACIRYGIGGPLLYFCAILPQGICYFFSFLLYVRWLRGLRGYSTRPFGKMLQFLVIFLLFLMGILLESYVNPLFLRFFIKNFL